MAVVVAHAQDVQRRRSERIARFIAQQRDDVVDLDVRVANAGHAEIGRSNTTNLENGQYGAQRKFGRIGVLAAVEPLFRDLGNESAVADQCCTPVVADMDA